MRGKFEHKQIDKNSFLQLAGLFFLTTFFLFQNKILYFLIYFSLSLSLSLSFITFKNINFFCLNYLQCWNLSTKNDHNKEEEEEEAWNGYETYPFFIFLYFFLFPGWIWKRKRVNVEAKKELFLEEKKIFKKWDKKIVLFFSPNLLSFFPFHLTMMIINEEWACFGVCVGVRKWMLCLVLSGVWVFKPINFI